MKIGGQIPWNATPVWRNIQDLLSDGKTSYERRFGKPLKGPIIPFRSLVEYYPITAKDQSRILQFGKKVLPGFVPRIRSVRGGDFGRVTQWLQTLRSWKRWTHWKSTQKDSMQKEVILPKENEKFIFPAADERTKPIGGDQDLRTSTLIRQRPIQGEGHVDFLGEWEGSLPPPHDSFLDAGEAINDFWSMSGNFIYRHHIEPRIKLYSPREESSLCHWSTLTSPELLTRTWMLCKKAASMIIGISLCQEIFLIIGQVSLILLN